MKKERMREKSALPLRKHVGEDASKLIFEVAPGKKGGVYNLPYGGLLTAPPGVFSKKDVVTCVMVSPSDRHKYQPPLRSDEHLLSEVYLLGCSAKRLKKSISLRLPFYTENTHIFDTQLMVKRAEDSEWADQTAKFVHDESMVEFDTTCGGIYAVTSFPKRERFDVPAQGCLYNAKINHQISVRFPKKATDTDMTCDITIIPLNRESLPALRTEFPQDMSELVAASDWYDIRPSVAKEFRRAVTVKLPLPDMDAGEFPEQDLAVMQTTPGGWELNEVPLKIVKNSVSFDTKCLNRYCVCLAKPQRKKRLKETFKHIGVSNHVTRGEILPFVHFQEKLWTIWFDLVPLNKVDDVIEKRLRQGFIRVLQQDLPLLQQSEAVQDTNINRRSWRSTRAKQVEDKPQKSDLDLVNGQIFQLDVSGDVRIAEEDSGRTNLGLQYHDRLPDNYRRYQIAPIQKEEGRTLTAFLKCFFTNTEGSKSCVRTFDFDVGHEAVKAYFYVEPEPEPVSEPEPEPEPEAVLEPVPEMATSLDVKDQKQRPMTASFIRLTAPTKPVRKIFRESRVLTGKSLMTLAREVEQGLTLAIHLDISDSAITGMGFDALANGLSLVDITYRILLLWKRKSKKYKEKQVELLAVALEEMGRQDLAGVVMDRDRQNQELTADCFEVTAAE